MSSLLLLLLAFSLAECWRPMLSSVGEPTLEYRAPSDYGPPSPRLRPPPPGYSPWLGPQPVHRPPALPPTYLFTTPVIITPATPTAPPPTRAITLPPPAIIVQGHSKVKKYGPVEGSVNSVFLQFGKKV